MKILNNGIREDSCWPAFSLLDPQCKSKCSFIVIAISKLLKRHSKFKRRAPAYSRALRQITEVKNSPWEVMERGGPVVVFGTFGADGRWYESHSSRHVGTLDKSFTHSCLYNVMWRPASLPCG